MSDVASVLLRGAAEWSEDRAAVVEVFGKILEQMDEKHADLDLLRAMRDRFAAIQDEAEWKRMYAFLETRCKQLAFELTKFEAN